MLYHRQAQSIVSNVLPNQPPILTTLRIQVYRYILRKGIIPYNFYVKDVSSGGLPPQTEDPRLNTRRWSSMGTFKFSKARFTKAFRKLHPGGRSVPTKG